MDPRTSSLLQTTLYHWSRQPNRNEFKKNIGSLLYYARAVDSIPLPTLNDIAAEQTQITVKTDKAVSKLLDYTSTYPNATIFYSASDMVLHIDSDVSYLNLLMSVVALYGVLFS